MFTTIIRVNFFDADNAGILFFGNFFRIVHSAYEEFLTKGKLKRNYFDDDKYAIPIIHTSAEFIKPIYPNTNIEVQLSISEIKKSSFVIKYKILNSKKQLLAGGTTVHVFVERKNWKKADIPLEIKKYLQKHI